MVNDKFFTNFMEKDSVVYFVGSYMEVCIPYYYFENGMAQIVENRIDTLAVFLLRIYKNKDKSDKAENHVYQLPAMITTAPSTYHKDKLSFNRVTQEYMILEYYTNDVFLNSTTIIQDSTFANKYITFYHNGKIPNFVKYDDTVLIELEAEILHKMSIPVPCMLLEAIDSEINRDITDLTKSFRYQAAEGADPHHYQPISIKDIPTYTSTFSSITFEDIDYQMLSAVNKTRNNKVERMSPIEETLKY